LFKGIYIGQLDDWPAIGRRIGQQLGDILLRSFVPDNGIGFFLFHLAKIGSLSLNVRVATNPKGQCSIGYHHN